MQKKFSRNIKIINKNTPLKLFLMLVFLMHGNLYSQVKTSVDSTKVKIGAQVNYTIEIEADTTQLVVFPETQTFSPLEVIEFYETDTLKNNDKYRLIKKYGLTQFDSGWYQIPRQKILIDERSVFSDSIYVYFQDVAVDTTKQKLFDIKPIIEVDKPKSKTWLYILIGLLIVALIAALLYWFIWRKKPLTEEEKIAQLPPFERAKVELQKLDNSKFLIQDQTKEYYSELTRILRSFIDEKVYDRAMESTSGELVEHLEMLTEAKQLKISNEIIQQINTIFRRADLAKFAKQDPDMESAKSDLNTIDKVLDAINKALPEPSEEEKLLNEQYREAQERKAKRRKVILTSAIVAFLLIATVIGFGIKYGFVYMKDVVIGKATLELLEGEWVDSDYGMPPIYISTPEVLKRMDAPVPAEFKDKIKMTAFGYQLEEELTIAVTTTNLTEPQENLDLNAAIEGNLQTLESRGITNIVTLNEKFTTPNGAEGIKTFGTLSVPKEKKEGYIDGNYVMLSFTSKDVIIQQIVLVWKANDRYANEIAERIINSVELQPKSK
ncbi:hypothetical protein [Paucihalobacter sp.]|uniref:hypothetical protein n=1 Tax=Paucihalobacter sp. TaxID=2850405 RepID=UPI002FE35AD8